LSQRVETEPLRAQKKDDVASATSFCFDQLGKTGSRVIKTAAQRETQKQKEKESKIWRR